MNYMLGKYEREALERERTSLHCKRRMDYHGLTQAEGQRLDWLEDQLGQTPETAVNNHRTSP